MDNVIEREWKPVRCALRYDVSNYGEIRNSESHKQLKTFLSKDYGYMYIQIVCNDGIPRTKKVHRLVADAFIPNPLGKPCVNHKDFDRKNNCVSNLEWVTHRENSLWSSENISRAAKGKKLNYESRKKLSQSLLAKYKRQYPPYIYKTRNGYAFSVARFGKRVVYKQLKTLEEAIAFKTSWEKEHQEVINFL